MIPSLQNTKTAMPPTVLANCSPDFTRKLKIAAIIVVSVLVLGFAYSLKSSGPATVESETLPKSESGDMGIKSSTTEGHTIHTGPYYEEFQHDKPLLVLHLGPPRTATTALQTDLFHLTHELEEDGYFCGGQFYDFDAEIQGRKGRIANYMKTTPLLDEAVQMLRRDNCSPPEASCLSKFKRMLHPYRNSRRNVLLSSESFSWLLSPGTAFDAIQGALADEWDILLILGYRHFFDWAPSDLFQRFRLDRQTPANLYWPGDSDGLGKSMESATLFPYQVKASLSNSPTYTASVRQRIRKKLPVRILNMHQPEFGSIRSNFFCNVMPDTPYTCEKSKEMDREAPQIVVNAQANVTHMFYDIVTTAAADRGWIDTVQYSRTRVRETLRMYNERGLHQTALEAFDLSCPSQEELDSFLEATIELQKHSFSNEYNAAMEIEHRTTFHERVASNAFCWVDTETTLTRPQWIKFFAQYAPPV